MCPGADDETLDLVLPFLQKMAVKDKKGNPCVGKAGTGGSGHYVKMIHNGIEHGMMSAISEAWSIMVTGLGMSYDEIADTFDKWNKDGGLASLIYVCQVEPELTSFIGGNIPYLDCCRHLQNKRREDR